MICKRIAAGFVLLAACAAQAFTLTADNAGQTMIVASESPVARQAASELQFYLEAITGAKVEIGNAPWSSRAYVIYVLDAPNAAYLLEGFDPAELKTDEIVLKTVEDDLILTGGGPRGVLYAVYELLEKTGGVRWWTSSETDIPQRQSLDFGAIDLRYAPAIVNRESFYNDVIVNPEFASHLRCNGHFEQLGPQFGGHYEIIGFCHTFDQLIPAAEYFEAHPEWFSLRDGRRVGGQFEGQLCPMNPELRALLIDKALQWLRQHPDPRVISITQNDNRNYCQCPECAALTEAEGSAIAPLLLLVNQAADAIAAEFPEVKIETLAYQYTRKAPKTMVPRDNVIIRLCSIECDFSKPLDSEANAAFRDDVLAWAKLAPELAIWNYVTNFTNYLLPHPNLTSLGADIRFFAANRVTALFEQGDFQSGGVAGDFVAMRAWVLAKLMWDPALDQEALIDEFLTGYYGEVNAPVLREYLECLEQAAADSGVRLGCFRRDTRDWLDMATLDEIGDILDQLDLEDRPERIYRTLLPLMAVLAERSLGTPEERRAFAALLDQTELSVEDCAEFVGMFVEMNPHAEVKKYREGRDFSELEAEMERRLAEIAAEAEVDEK